MFRRFVVTPLLFSLTSAAHGSLLENGSFELLAPGLPLPDGAWSVYDSLPGWDVDRVEVQRGTIIRPFDGLNYIELDTDGPNSHGSIEQSFATELGGSYRFSFAFASRPELASASNAIEVNWGDRLAPASTLLVGLSQSNIGLASGRWQVFEYFFTATATSSFVRFAAAGRADTLGGLLDGVVVDRLLRADGMPSVPVPPAVWLLGSALVALTGLARRPTA